MFENTNFYFYFLYIFFKLSQNSHALNYTTHTFQVSPQYQECSKLRERYYNSCNPQEK